MPLGDNKPKVVEVNGEISFAVNAQIPRVGRQISARVGEYSVAGAHSKTMSIFLLEYCVRYDTAPFVRLLLQHGAWQLSASNYSLGDFASLRGDQGIIQALDDHGVRFDLFPTGESSEYETVPQALVNISHYLPITLPHGQIIRQ